MQTEEKIRDYAALDKPRDECGVIALYAPGEEASRMAYFGLYALQHRGQESAGIAVSDGVKINKHKDVGLVSQVFNETNLAALPGHIAIGHTRYSTTGSSSVRNAQPFLIDTQYGPVAMAHNGNITNAAVLRHDLLKRGIGLSSSSDSGVILMTLAGAEGETWEARLQHAMPQWQGAYSLVILTQNCALAVRDPWGFRPLSVGILPGGGFAAASESGALQTLGCTRIREVLPGEIVSLSAAGLNSCQGLPPAPNLARCTFEQIYFSRPDSQWDNLSVHHVRQRLGAQLWEEVKLETDLVIPVPDSSVPAAIAYARASGIPYNDGFIKNRYIGRTFIQPTDNLRRQGVAMKFNVLAENVRDKRVMMLDDSIVRGNTSGPLVKMLRQAGAREVHIAITCPPIAYPCFMGVDMGSHEELIAHRMTIAQMQAHIGCDSLHFLSLEGMMHALGRKEGYCNACFTGKYPIPVDVSHTKTGFE
jgi:amidophosphoribosyltransferase